LNFPHDCLEELLEIIPGDAAAPAATPAESFTQLSDASCFRKADCLAVGHCVLAGAQGKPGITTVNGLAGVVSGTTWTWRTTA